MTQGHPSHSLQCYPTYAALMLMVWCLAMHANMVLERLKLNKSISCRINKFNISTHVVSGI